jgi:hypothetical protein
MSAAAASCSQRAPAATSRPLLNEAVLSWWLRVLSLAWKDVGAFGAALGSGLVADLLTIDELEKRALAVVQKIEDELEAELQGQVESYLEMMNSNR